MWVTKRHFPDICNQVTMVRSSGKWVRQVLTHWALSLSTSESHSAPTWRIWAALAAQNPQQQQQQVKEERTAHNNCVKCAVGPLSPKPPTVKSTYFVYNFRTNECNVNKCRLSVATKLIDSSLNAVEVSLPYSLLLDKLRNWEFERTILQKSLVTSTKS